MSTTTDYTAIESVEDGVSVEIYKASGIDSSPEAREEAFQIADTLGLENQKSAYKSEQGVVEWPVANAEIAGLLCMCFRKNDTIEEYSGTIPLSVMREYERLRSLCDSPDSDYDLHHVVIRSPQETASPDPVMFALLSRSGKSSWDGKWHIIARWGSALLPIDELRKIAKESAVSDLVKIRNSVDLEIKNIQDSPRPVFNSVPSPHRWDNVAYKPFESRLA